MDLLAVVVGCEILQQPVVNAFSFVWLIPEDVLQQQGVKFIHG